MLAVAVLAAVIALDQLTKHLVADGITPGAVHHVIPGLELVHTSNAGVAFGLAAGAGTVVAIAIGLVLLGVVVIFARDARRPWAWLPTGMLLGGAISNIVDRVANGSVTDFIKLPLGWPPFNVADAAITVGVIALAVVLEASSRRAVGT